MVICICCDGVIYTRSEHGPSSHIRTTHLDNATKASTRNIVLRISNDLASVGRIPKSCNEQWAASIAAAAVQGKVPLQ